MASTIRQSLSALGALFLSLASAGAVDITPLRQVVTPEEPEKTFTVSNSSDRILTGSVGWIHLSASETGYTQTPPEVRSALSAAPWLIVSPASFSLPPGSRREIQVSLKPGTTPPDGERRSHLMIETAAERTPMHKASNTGLPVDIGVGVSVPVILRGLGEADARITDVKLVRDRNGDLVAEATITPRGTHSTYGRVTAQFTPKGKNAKPVVMAELANVAGYPDASKRRVKLSLNTKTLGKGSLLVRYEGVEEYAGQIFAERRFDIQSPK